MPRDDSSPSSLPAPSITNTSSGGTGTSSGGDTSRYTAVQPFEVDELHDDVDYEYEASSIRVDANQQHCRRCYLSIAVAVICILLSVSIKFWVGASTEQLASSEEDPFAFAGGKSEPSQSSESCQGFDLSSTIKVVFSAPFAALHGSSVNGKYEASDVTVADGHAYVVHDSLWEVSRIDLSSLSVPLSPKHAKIVSKTKRPKGQESDYEAIFIHAGTLYAVRESIKFEKGEHPLLEGDTGYHAVIEELRTQNEGAAGWNYEAVESCPTEFEFESDNKGFEGALGLIDQPSGELFVLGLCEGNDCKARKESDERPGNGKIVIMKKRILEKTGECVWETVRMLSIPSSANFRDYSAIALLGDVGTVAIASQEDSKLWVGKLLRTTSLSNLAFDESIGQVYSFPVSSSCNIQYCNVEGIYFLSEGLLVGTSDKAKGKGKQPFSCMEKDQSLHLFALP